MKSGSCLAIAAALLNAGSGWGAADWPTLQLNNRRTGYIDDLISPPYKEAWRHDFEEMIDCRVQPIVAGGIVLVPTYQRRLHALDAATGKPRWVFKTDGPIFHSPSVTAGRVYLGCQDRFVYCLDLGEGKERWRFETGEGIWASPAIEGGAVYVGSRDGVFYALKAENGAEMWRFKTPQPILTTAAIEGDTVYFASEDLNAYALNRHTGGLIWKQPTIGQSLRSYWPVVSERFVYFRTLPVRSWAQHPYNVKANAQIADPVERVAELLGRDSFSRTFFAFDKRSGRETIFPVLWTAGGGTVPFPPVVLPGHKILTPAPTGERTASSGSSSVSIIDETTRQPRRGYIRVIADESYGYSVSGPYLFSSHHDYLQYVDLRKDPDQARNTVTVLGHRDRPVDERAAQWFGHHDNHPGWHSASLANGHIYWINQGSWLFVFKGGSSEF